MNKINTIKRSVLTKFDTAKGTAEKVRITPFT
ncbi:hypothetical protein SDC9_150681 [bioreactor metagenome]|uniref:Uncharacterized protein n=1 Tax=bioreactor metagenome TaxID=1076179 RepID=A0A645EN71_9ZZZZ